MKAKKNYSPRIVGFTETIQPAARRIPMPMTHEKNTQEHPPMIQNFTTQTFHPRAVESAALRGTCTGISTTHDE